jgi:hypothetical protein
VVEPEPAVEQNRAADAVSVSIRSDRPGLAYLVGTRLDPHLASTIGAARQPRPEFRLFVERNAATVLERSRDLGGRSPIGALFPRQARGYWDLGAAALAARPKYAGFLCSGEDVGLPLAVQALLTGASRPIFIITHGSYFGSPKFRLLMLALRRSPTVHYLCLSDSLRRQLVDRFGVSPRRAHNTGYGVDTTFFRPAWSEATEPLIVSAGSANRDFETLVAATGSVEADLRIAADSAWFPLPAAAPTPGPRARVTIRSAGDYVGLRDLYARARFVVVPLRPARHACGYAVTAEAMAMGKAVILSRTAAPGDFLLPGVTGYEVGVGDVDGLRQRVEQLWREPSEAARLGQNGRARIEQHFSVESYVERIEQVIDGARPSPAVSTGIPAGLRPGLAK